MSIYQDNILDHYRNPRNHGRIIRGTKKSTEVFNPLCGDRIIMDILIDPKKGTVRDIRFSGNGCAISQAAGSLLTEAVKGKTKDQLRKLDRRFMIDLLGITLGPNRVKCALLPLEALLRLI